MYNNFTVIDTETLSSEMFSDPTWKIAPRASHSAVQYGTKIIIFGGFDGVTTFFNG